MPRNPILIIKLFKAARVSRFMFFSLSGPAAALVHRARCSDFKRDGRSSQWAFGLFFAAALGASGFLKKKWVDRFFLVSRIDNFASLPENLSEFLNSESFIVTAVKALYHT